MINVSITVGKYQYRYRKTYDNTFNKSLTIHQITPDRQLALCTDGTEPPKWLEAHRLNKVIELRPIPAVA